MKKIISKIILFTCMALLSQQAYCADGGQSTWEKIQAYSSERLQAAWTGFNDYCVQPAKKTAYDYRYGLAAAGIAAATGGVGAVGVCGVALKTAGLGALAGGAVGASAYGLRKKNETGVTDVPGNENVLRKGAVLETAWVGYSTVAGVCLGNIAGSGVLGPAAMGVAALASSVGSVKNIQDTVNPVGPTVALATGFVTASFAATKIPRADNRSVIVPAVLLMSSSWMNGLCKTRSAQSALALMEEKYATKVKRAWWDVYGHVDYMIKAALCGGCVAGDYIGKDKDTAFFAEINTLMSNPSTAKNKLQDLFGSNGNFDKNFIKCVPIKLEQRQQRAAAIPGTQPTVLVRTMRAQAVQAGTKLHPFVRWYHVDHGAVGGAMAAPGRGAAAGNSISTSQFEAVLKEYQRKVENDLKKLCSLSSISFEEIKKIESFAAWTAFEKKVKGLLNYAGTAMMLGHLGYSAFHNHDRVKHLMLRLVQVRKCIMQLKNINAGLSRGIEIPAE